MRDITKEETISLHRQMWGWIADKIEEEQKIHNIHYLKQDYLEERGEQAVNNCYCCEYAERQSMLEPAAESNHCICCPLDWENPDVSVCPCELYGDDDEPVFEFRDGLYGRCRKFFDNPELCDENNWEEQAEYARRIANLKEKEEL